MNEQKNARLTWEDVVEAISSGIVQAALQRAVARGDDPAEEMRALIAQHAKTVEIGELHLAQIEANDEQQH